jgi:hypothetical protein
LISIIIKSVTPPHDAYAQHFGKALETELFQTIDHYHYQLRQTAAQTSSRLVMIPLRSCTLRRYRAGDEASLALHANDHDIWRNLRDRFPHPYTEADALAWVAHASAQSPVTDLAIEVGGAVVGGIGIIPQLDIHRRSAEIGVFKDGQPIDSLSTRPRESVSAP